MNTLNGKFAIIRKALNCTQEELATWLGISRGFLANIEKRRRLLPDDTELQLIDVYKVILNTQPQPVREAVSALPHIMDYSMGLYRQLEKLQEQLTEAQATRKQALETLQLVAAIRAAVDANENLHLFLEVLEAAAQMGLGKHSATSIALLQAKIKATRAAWTAVADDKEYIV